MMKFHQASQRARAHLGAERAVARALTPGKDKDSACDEAQQNTIWRMVVTATGLQIVRKHA